MKDSLIALAVVITLAFVFALVGYPFSVMEAILLYVLVRIDLRLERLHNNLWISASLRSINRRIP